MIYTEDEKLKLGMGIRAVGNRITAIHDAMTQLEQSGPFTVEIARKLVSYALTCELVLESAAKEYPRSMFDFYKYYLRARITTKNYKGLLDDMLNNA